MQTIPSQQTIPQTLIFPQTPLVDQQEICSLRNQCAQDQNATVDPNPSAHINHQALLTTVLAFGIPTFHESLTTKDSTFAFGECSHMSSQHIFHHHPGLNVPVWEAVR